MTMRLEINHAQSVICWLIISELAVGEEALLWFTESRSLLKRSKLVRKPHLSVPNELCNLHPTISVSMWSTGRRTQTSTKLARAPFYAKLADYVETFEELPTLGDFKIRMDVAGDSDAIKLSYLFQAVGLQWRVEQHTHVQGHTLAVVISRRSVDIIEDYHVLTVSCRTMERFCSISSQQNHLYQIRLSPTESLQ